MDQVLVLSLGLVFFLYDVFGAEIGCHIEIALRVSPRSLIYFSFLSVLPSRPPDWCPLPPGHPWTCSSTVPSAIRWWMITGFSWPCPIEAGVGLLVEFQAPGEAVPHNHMAALLEV